MKKTRINIRGFSPARIFYFIFAASLLNSVNTFSQHEKIKIRKQNDQLFFFREGIQNDTVVKNKNDLFYLLVPDSVSNLIISVENGNLQKTKNDSIVKLIYIPGIKYECLYAEKQKNPDPGNKKTTRERNCLINGVSGQSANTIKITFNIKGQTKPILENKFVFQ